MKSTASVSPARHLNLAEGFAGFLLFFFCTQVSAEETNQTEPVAVRLALVQTAKATKTTVQPASVHAYFVTGIRPQVTGYIKEIAVDIGDIVKQGDTLAEIDLPEMHEQLMIAKARLDRRRAEEQRASAGIELAEATVLSATSKVEEVESDEEASRARVAAAQAEFDRTEDLVNRQSVQARLLDESRMKLDAAKAELSSANSAIASATAEVKVAQAKLVAAKADLTAAKADAQVAEAELKEIQVMLNFGTLKAPFNGVVIERNVNPGDLVIDSQTNHPPLFTLHQTERVRIQTHVPERDAVYVNRGDKFEVSFSSFPSETIEAIVTRTSTRLDQTTRTMLVEAELENKDGKLIPGMFGEATISLSINQAAKTLPASAVRFGTSGEAFVYKVDSEGEIKQAVVKLGHDDGIRVEILEGVEREDRVVDAHLQRFVDGQKVKVLP